MSASRRRSESGAAAVEFAILAPLVLAIAFGVLSGGLAWNTKQTLTHGTREAVRFAATKPQPADGDWGPWLRAVAEHAIDSSFGELNDGQTGRQLCIAFIGDGVEQRLVIDDGEDTSDLSTAGTVSPGDCFADNRGADEPRVQAHLRRKTNFIAVLYNRVGDNALPLESTAVARHERPSLDPTG